MGELDVISFPDLGNRLRTVANAIQEYPSEEISQLLGQNTISPSHSALERDDHEEILPQAYVLDDEYDQNMQWDRLPMFDVPENEGECDISQFFDFDKAAQGTTTHAPASSEQFGQNCPILEVNTQSPLGNCFASSDISTPASDPEGLNDSHGTKGTKGTTKTVVHPDGVAQSSSCQPYQHLSSKIPLPIPTIRSHYTNGLPTDTEQENIQITTTPSPSSATILPPGEFGSYTTEDALRVFHCFEIKGLKRGREELHPPAKKPRKEANTQQREEARQVREKSACLRCYVFKLKCSKGYPCNTCIELFERAHGSKTLQWRACVESSLVEINIFTYGLQLLSKQGHALSGQTDPLPSGWRTDREIMSKLPTLTTASLYNAVLMLLSFGGETSLLSFLDSLYVDILRLQGRPNESKSAHYLHYLRAISSILAFEGLWLSLERTALEHSSYTRLLSLAVYISVLLEQITELGRYKAVPRYLSSDDAYETMRSHLVEYLTYYLRKISTTIFSPDAQFLTVFKKREGDLKLRAAFWEKLSTVTGMTFLKRLPKAHELLERGDRTDNVDPALKIFIESDVDML